MSARSDTPVIRLRGVRQHNLKNLNLDLPTGRLIVITGPSGSGKSSLAFDTLFAEGQRRYIETFSPYARQFFDRMDKPQVDAIEGIPPAIALEQRNSVRTTRSTVGTMTEICDYLKVVWRHLAQLHCRQCGRPVRKDSPQDIWQAEGRRRKAECLITFDLPLSERMSLEESLALVAKQGYRRLLVGGEVCRVDDGARHPALRAQPSELAIVQDRLALTESNRARFIEACEQAYHFGKGKLALWKVQPPASLSQPHRFSNRLHCASCDLEYREPTPALFSFNHPLGACPTCRGFGRTITIDYDRVIPDTTRTLAQGVVKPWLSGQSAECQEDLMKFCRQRNVPTGVPFRDLPQAWRDWVIDGDAGYGTDPQHRWPRAWYGVKGYFRWLESRAYKMHVRVLLSRYRAYTTCPACQGQRFQPDALLFRVPLGDFRPTADAAEPDVGPSRLTPFSASLSLADLYRLPLRDARAFIGQLATKHHPKPSDPVALALAEVRSRLAYLVEVGLGYLTLDRPTRSLSGGETERVNLTSALGTRLVNTLYVLDEPSVGLHPSDTARLVGVLERLRDLGNTVVVVEHEAGVIRAADQIVDLGPGSGEAGGRLRFQGGYAALLRSNGSLTGEYLSGRKAIPVPARRALAQNWLRISGATRHNLRNLSVEIPLGRFVCVTGVSGSGKTTLVRDVLLRALETRLPMGHAQGPTADAESRSVRMTGWETLGRVVLVDQSPLGKTPRSNPAVYLGAFDAIRELFARTDLAKQRGLKASAFSFNSVQGQCERCGGAGFEKIEMQFLSDVFIRCPECQGRRYRPHVLEVKIGKAKAQSPKSNRRVPRPEDQTPEATVQNPNSAFCIPHAALEWSIADLLEATVDEAAAFLSAFRDSRAGARAVGALRLLQEVGLGYLRLGQPVNTLSGGESQRLKLVSHLGGFGTADASGAGTGPRSAPAFPRAGPPEHRPPTAAATPTLFLFDEPTTGLHFDDVRMLLRVFQRLVNAGHSVVVIEHNLDVIKCADWLIDLGPEAGDEGGEVVAQGTPEEVAKNDGSRTGRCLREWLVREDLGAAGAPVFGVPPLGGECGRLTRTSPDRLKAELQTSVDCLNGEVRTRPAPVPEARPGREIVIHGAREHNLKQLTVAIPRNRFVVITGVSGSGKSTLAFDLLFAEGQRRFLDSMNAYARQFVEQLARPDVDLITGIPPTVSIEQRNTRGGGKSTVATVTEIYHFLRLLFARLGSQHCPDCGAPVETQTRDEVGRRLAAEAKRRGDLWLLAPVVRQRKGFHTEVAAWAAKHGYATVRADGRIEPTDRPLRLDRFREHNVEIVVGVLESCRRRNRRAMPLGPTLPGRSHGKPPQQLVDEAAQLGGGMLLALDHLGQVTVHSTERACPGCGRSFEPLDPRQFSYNSPQGWCPKCRGFGELFYLPDVDRGADADAIEESWFGWQEGHREVCPDCSGARLNPVARAVRLEIPNLKASLPHRRGGATLDTFALMTVSEAWRVFAGLQLEGGASAVARDILPELRERLRFLEEVGLGYLQLGRGVTTLSGGEAQRIRLAAQLGSNLSGVLYILDEPTIGLHARDNEQLLAALERLKARGNSLIVVEHDEATMRRADHIVDLGPGAGARGGEVVASGTFGELLRHRESITGQCLRRNKSFPSRGRRRPVPTPGAEKGRIHSASGRPKSSARIPTPKVARPNAATRDPHSASGGWLTLHHAAVHNLRHLTVWFPLNRLVVVTGVSGSGKSTLLRDCLMPALQRALRGRGRGGSKARAGAGGGATAAAVLSGYVTGHETLRAVEEVDQSPIGRTPRSVPATYVGVFDDIRRLFAQVPESRMRGYSPSRFSFNSAHGRCAACEGAGTIKLEMSFMPPAFVECETCQGRRFDPETLDIEFNGRNIAQVLELSVAEALEVFGVFPRIQRPLMALRDTGLGYLRLGQPSPTLSGGEAQRLKLVTHLLAGWSSAATTGRRNLFVLEEPTIGLHADDVRRLVEVLQRLVDAGHSVIVIEHNLDLIAEADWLIDLGPEGGAGGGRIVSEGPPERVTRIKRSHTGRFLRSLLPQR